MFLSALSLHTFSPCWNKGKSTAFSRFLYHLWASTLGAIFLLRGFRGNVLSIFNEFICLFCFCFYLFGVVRPILGMKCYKGITSKCYKSSPVAVVNSSWSNQGKAIYSSALGWSTAVHIIMHVTFIHYAHLISGDTQINKENVKKSYNSNLESK